MSRQRRNVAWGLCLSLVAVGACCCGQSNTAMSSSGRSLYDRLGGEAAIRAVVDEFVARASANPKVNLTRKGTPREWDATPENVAHVKMMLVQLVASASGGPQKYTGRDMKSAHRGMQISNAEFDAAAADLKASLDKFNVPAAEQGELLKIVASTRGDIVERETETRDV